MALLTTQQIDITGSDVTHAAASTSDTVNPSPRTFVWYKNTNASSRTITVVVPGSRFGQDLADVEVTLPATTGEKVIGPLTRELADPSTGLVTVTLDADTDVTVAAVRI